ncbi:tripartite tricarboxylate transporter substrate binding protein BugE [Lampropedia puyangensis]|uniref:Tripartite tricarboxylate transporter substrate binding protein BugE n=1 Tax=Lampropedia puyangensis TaxID=1330072 RepID=A0A4S8F165_9BURK|nr:tripartite tricarboxylate transporter substrate binding protein BugE [Lampropedia puyangensis]THU00659.1 tripartite tricarboxylate transporter substrate binding protein BugE [Lampropedia puyangensis]
MRLTRRTCLAVAATVALAFSAGTAIAQANYPNKPIRLLVPFAAGGTTDIIARAISEPLGKELGQSIVVENKGGGGGVIGAGEAARAAPDGYNLSVATVSTTASNPAINPNISYNPLTDFTPVINMAATPNVVVVHPSFPAKNYEEFIKEVSSNPGKYSYASSGTGGIGHLQTELFKTLANLDMQHIPYRGAGPGLNDAVAGQVPIMFDNLPSALPFITSGRLRAIVVAANERVAAIPDVPTFKEVGLEPANRMAYYGILGPKDMPPEIVDKLNAAVKKVLQEPAVRKRIEDTGSIVVANTPAEFAAEIKAEFDVYSDVVKKQNLKLE